MKSSASEPGLSQFIIQLIVHVCSHLKRLASYFQVMLMILHVKFVLLLSVGEGCKKYLSRDNSELIRKQQEILKAELIRKQNTGLLAMHQCNYDVRTLFYIP